ncbi:MAG: GAF domain-containing protein, partial [Acidimicrobiales bacterium]
HMLVVTHGLPAGSAYPGSELDEPVERVLSTNRPLIVCDSHSHDRGDGAVAPVDPGVRAYIGVPVLGPGGDSLGALCVMDRRPHDWNDHELALLGGLAEVAAAEVLAAPLVSKAHG